jgi:hypothetical protein
MTDCLAAAGAEDYSAPPAHLALDGGHGGGGVFCEAFDHCRDDLRVLARELVVLAGLQRKQERITRSDSLPVTVLSEAKPPRSFSGWP